MPLSTALHTSIWMASKPLKPSANPITVAAAMML
jgi:hypothetical protein